MQDITFVKNMRLLPSFLIVFVATLQLAMAQTIDENNFTHYTKIDGLSHNYISCIAQDSLGSLWIGTHKGLNSFDGIFFKHWFKQTTASSLPDNLINALRITSGHELIGSTLGGAFVFNIKTLHQKRLIIPSDSSIYFWANQGDDIIKDKAGNYIVSTKTGLFIFNEQGTLKSRFDYYQKEDAGKRELMFGSWLHVLTNGSVLQKNEAGFWVYNPYTNRLTQQSFADSILSDVHNEDVKHTTYYIDNNDNLLAFNTQRNVLGVWQKNEKRQIQINLPAGETISGFYKCGDTLSAVTYANGGFSFLSYTPLTGNYVTHPEKYFANKKCTYLFKDREQRLWIGTTDGLYKENLFNPFFKHVTLTDEHSNTLYHDIKSILIKKNIIFMGLDHYGGIAIMDKKQKKIKRRLFISTKANDNSNSIYYLFNYHPDTLWLGTGKGLFWMNINNYHVGKISLPPPLAWMDTSPPNCFFEDSRHCIWMSFGLPNSVVIYNRSDRTFTPLSTEKNPLLRTTKCWSMAEDKQGDIWLAGDGLCRWNRSTQRVDLLISYPTVTTALRNYMLILDRDESNNLWLSSFDNEIIQFNCTTHKMVLKKKESNLIDGNTVTSSPIINETIWLGTDNGISAFNLHDNAIQQFTYADGLPTVVITTYRKSSYYDSLDNYFYVGARNHLISFRPDVALSQRKNPELLIESVQTADTSITTLTSPLSFTYQQNDVTINFKAINFNDPEDNRFMYGLVQTDTVIWHELNRQNFIYLNNLSPGPYTVEIKLFSANNRWPDQTQQIHFIIHPPFWKTWWFVLLVSIVIIFTTYLLYRIRIKNIRQKANVDLHIAELEMKALHAQMNPHFIFNSLNGIKDMILDGDKASASRYLSRFAHLIRLNLMHVQQNSISLFHQIEYLTHYLDMEKLRFNDFTYTIDVDEDLDTTNVKLIPMLLQPLVENAIWHGLLPTQSKKELSVRFKKYENELLCEIDDNGIGINAARTNKSNSLGKHQSMGIKNIQHRLQVLNRKYNINCSLEINDKQDLPDYHSTQGTLVILRLPMISLKF